MYFLFTLPVSNFWSLSADRCKK